MRKNPRRILSPQRLPFRHPGAGYTNLTNTNTYCNSAILPLAAQSAPVSIVVPVERSAGAFIHCAAASVCFGAKWECQRVIRMT